MFDILKEKVNAVDMAETPLFGGRGSQFLKAGDVKDVGRKVKELEQLLVIV